MGGEMHYLRNPRRHDPRQVLPSAQSVVCVGLVYNAPLPYSVEVHNFPKRRKAEGPASISADAPAGQFSDSPTAEAPAPTGWISRYAWGRDYHKVMKAKLEALRSSIESFAPGVETRVYVDTGPIVERAFARFSGIGWMGKNTCLINAEKGSWFFLGVILTNLLLGPDIPAPDRCGSCRRCIEACPTGALDEPYVMDASSCIAYFTIELKGSIPTQFREAVGINVFGCDICQDVCPWNSRRTDAASQPVRREPGPRPGSTQRKTRSAAETSLAEFQPKQVHASGKERRSPKEFSLYNPSLAALASVTEEEFQLNFKGTPLQRSKFRGFMRNLCIAMGNSRNLDLVPVIQQLATYQDPLIREHARWALGQLEKCHSQSDHGI